MNQKPNSQETSTTRSSAAEYLTFIASLKESQEPEVVTVNGAGAVVVQDAESYREMALHAEQTRQDARLQKAAAYFRDGGKGIKAADVFANLDAKYL